MPDVDLDEALAIVDDDPKSGHLWHSWELNRAAALVLAAELRRWRGQDCATCKHRAVAPDGTEWCCVAPDGVEADSIREGDIGQANWACGTVNGGCRAHEPQAGA